MGRRAARERILKALYQIDVGKVEPERIVEEIIEDVAISEKESDFIIAVIRKTLEAMSSIDEIITRYAQNWSLERMAKIDRAILRMAIAEVLYFNDIPRSVSVNEAVELAKKYGDANSSRFINGILGAFLRENSNVAQI